LLIRCPSVPEDGEAGGVLIIGTEPTACNASLHVPAVPHLALSHRLAVLVRLIMAEKPRAVLVPVDVVCQYQFTPEGGWFVIVTSVDPQYLTIVMVAFGVGTLIDTDREPL